VARVKDLWLTAAGEKTAKHPDRGGNKTAKRWLAVWVDPDGNEKTKTFGKKTDAQKYAARMEADAERGEYIEPDAGTEKFGPLAEKYLRLRKVGGTTRVKYEQVYRNQVKPAFADRAVKAVRSSEVLEWLRSPAISKLASTTQNIAYMIVAGTFDLAVEDKMRRDNPARTKVVKAPPKGEPSHRDAWPADTVWKILDAHPERYRAIPAVSAGLGLRQGEALALTEEDFDFDALTVKIRRQVTRVGRTWVFKLPKEDRERTVPLSPKLAGIVKAHIEAYPPEPYELPWLKASGELADVPHACRLLFRWQSDDRRTNGKHIKFGSYDGGVWLPALAAAGVIELASNARDGARITGGSRGNGTHALRHFYSTILQDAGVSLAGVMEFMGHSRKGLPVTLSVYGHVTEDTFQQARDAIDSSLFRLRPVAPASGGTVTELRAAQ
jgi:integrase